MYTILLIDHCSDRSGCGEDSALESERWAEQSRRHIQLPTADNPLRTSEFIDDDEQFTLETKEKRPLHLIEPKTFVYHDACEGQVGTPSAQVLTTKDMGQCVFCFNCKVTIFANECWRSDPIYFEEDQEIQHLQSRFIPGKSAMISCIDDH